MSDELFDSIIDEMTAINYTIMHGSNLILLHIFLPNQSGAEEAMDFKLTASMMCANYGNLEREVRESLMQE